jgi:hypothetical protein
MDQRRVLLRPLGCIHTVAESHLHALVQPELFAATSGCLLAFR